MKTANKIGDAWSYTYGYTVRHSNYCFSIFSNEFNYDKDLVLEIKFYLH